MIHYELPFAVTAMVIGSAQGFSSGRPCPGGQPRKCDAQAADLPQSQDGSRRESTTAAETSESEANPGCHSSCGVDAAMPEGPQHPPSGGSADGVRDSASVGGGDDGEEVTSCRRAAECRDAACERLASFCKGAAALQGWCARAAIGWIYPVKERVYDFLDARNGRRKQPHANHASFVRMA